MKSRVFFRAVVHVRRPDGYLRVVEARLHQDLPDISSVIPSTLPLAGTWALDVDQHDWATQAVRPYRRDRCGKVNWLV